MESKHSGINFILEREGKEDTEVEGIQGAGPQIVFWGAVSLKVTYHGDHPPYPLPSVSSPLPSLINIKTINR